MIGLYLSQHMHWELRQDMTTVWCIKSSAVLLFIALIPGSGPAGDDIYFGFNRQVTTFSSNENKGHVHHTQTALTLLGFSLGHSPNLEDQNTPLLFQKIRLTFSFLSVSVMCICPCFFPPLAYYSLDLPFLFPPSRPVCLHCASDLVRT